MAKYHNSPNGPRICSSRRGLCPYAQAGQPHFESQREAQRAYENEMAKTFGSTVKLNRTLREKALQATYRGVDRVHDRVKLAQLSPTGHAAYEAISAVRDTASATATGASRLRSLIHAATTETPRRGEGQPSLGSMYRTADTRQRLLNEGVASRATSRQIAQVNHTPRVLSPYGKTHSMRVDSLTLGDRLETKEVVIGVQRGKDGTTNLTLQSGEMGEIRSATMNNGEPIRAARYHRRGERFNAGMGRMGVAISSLGERLSQASQQQREVLNTLRGVGYAQRAQGAVRLPEGRGQGRHHGTSPTLRGTRAHGEPMRYAMPGNKAMSRVNGEQYHQVAECKEIREVAQLIRQRRSDGQRLKAENVASPRVNA